MRRAVVVGMLCTFAFAAATAHATEPGWNAPQDLGPIGPDEALRARPLPGGEFLLLNHIYVGGQSTSYDVNVTDVRPDGSLSTQSLGQTDYNAADLATSASGAARAAWPSAGENGTARLWTAVRQPGGQFGTATELAPDGLGGRPSVAMNAAGDSVVVINRWDRLLAVFIPRGGAPSAPVTVATAPPQSQTSNTSMAGAWVALTDDGRALVVWAENRVPMTCETTSDGGTSCNGTSDNYSLHYAMGTSAGFDAPTAVADVVPHPVVWFAADRDGGAALAWRGDDNHASLVLRTPGGGFGPVRDLGYAYRVSLAVTPAGALTAAYAMSQNPPNTEASGPDPGPMATMIFGSTHDGTLGSAISGDQSSAVFAAAGWSGERMVLWQGSLATRAMWLEPDGTRAPTRNISCGGNPFPFGALVSDGRALALMASYDGNGGRMLGALARPDTAPTDLPCAAPGLPPGVVVNPAPLELDYSAYDNGFRKSTALMSPPAPNGHTSMPVTWSDGGSDNPAFSQDNRNARLFAFDSSATNLVAGDRNGRRDIFVVRRAKGGGNMFGRIILASRGPGSRQADGESSHPSLDGETGVDPHCVAFESTATNLDSRDRTRDHDVYLRDLRSGRTRFLSPGLRNATNAVVDGSCKTVTFEARGSVWVAAVRGGQPLRLARGSDPDQQTNGQGAAYTRHGQVWYRSFVLRGHRLARGRERLVSATPDGHRGNGASAHAAIDDVGAYVAFDSAATDLCGTICAQVTRDINGAATDVFRRTLSPRAPTKDRMELVSIGRYAASHDPTISAAGENVLFESDALETLRDGTRRGGLDPNQRRVFSWQFPRARMTGATRLIVRQCRQYQCAQASTRHPAMSSRGNYIAFAAQESEFCPPYNHYKVKGGRPDCVPFTDVFAQYVGPSHEGKPLG